MALYPPRHPLLRQPSHVARINERHWLARDLVFAHSGYGAFVFGRPVADLPSALRSNALTGAHNPSLVSARGWVPDGTNSETYALGVAALPLPLTLSAWWYGTSSTTNDAILAVGRSAGRGGVLLRRTSGELVSAQAIDTAGNTNGATASGGYASGRWQHGVGVWESATSRLAYADGGNVGTHAVSTAHPTDCDQIRLATTVTATPTPATTAIAGIAIPLVIARALDDEEIARLHEEQRSNPWVLFADRAIWVPGSAADTSAALTGAAATASAGTAASAVAQATTGQVATIVAGTLTPASSYALAGQAAAFAGGAVAPVVSVALAGASATFAAGTVVPAVSLVLSGTSAAASAGTAAAAASSALAGHAATAAAGTMTPAASAGLAGQAATASAGTAVPGASVALAGEAVAASAGTVVPSIPQTRALAGSAATLATGTLAGTAAYTLAGTAAALAAGTLQIDITRALAGQALTVEHGICVGGLDVREYVRLQSAITQTAAAASAINAAVARQSIITRSKQLRSPIDIEGSP